MSWRSFFYILKLFFLFLPLSILSLRIFQIEGFIDSLSLYCYGPVHPLSARKCGELQLFACKHILVLLFLIINSLPSSILGMQMQAGSPERIGWPSNDVCDTVNSCC